MEKKFNHDEYLKEYKKRVLTRLTMDMKREKREEIQRHADLHGETLTGYIKKAVEMRMAMDNCGADWERTVKKETQAEERTAMRPESAKSFGATIGDIGKAAANVNRKQGKMVLTEKGYVMVYGQEAEAEE